MKRATLFAIAAGLALWPLLPFFGRGSEALQQPTIKVTTTGGQPLHVVCGGGQCRATQDLREARGWLDKADGLHSVLVEK